MMRIVVMGVAGSGKTTVGRALAERIGATFLDGDSLHPDANVAKMSAGEALTDDDRWPWLARVRHELRHSGAIVIACSALRRPYRDLLRHADGARFVFLDLDETAALQRVRDRSDHYMGADMVAGQFAALERPTADETDVAVVDASADVATIVDSAIGMLASTTAGTAAESLIAEGGADRVIDDRQLAELVARIAAEHVLAPGHRRVLLVPPDHTRLHSRAGTICALLKAELEPHGCTVAVLPALGTHVAMDDRDAALLFGETIAADDLLVHDWRNGLATLGEIGADEVGVVTGGRYAEPIPIAVDSQLLAGWDLVVSVGQVVPHEVIGMANFTKNLVIGLGGAPTIHRSHFVGAVAGMERIMGRSTSAVRDVVDAAFDRFVEPRVNVLWVLTVIEDAGHALVQRGLFAGAGGTTASGGAAFRAAAELARRVNVDIVERPLPRVVCWLDPDEMRSTWLGNKAVYRTRMAVADGGELVVLAPGVERFGEDPAIDLLIRRHGYRGTPATLDAVAADPDLAANLGAAAHLVHGSSEGRFRIVYCTDPAAGGLTRDEIEGVGYEWRPLQEELERLALAAGAVTGERIDAGGLPYFFVANPALGLWSTAGRMER